MDVHHFDAITKTWGSLPRRRLLGGLAGSAFGVLAATLGVAPAEARTCRKRQTTCTKGRRCCGHKRKGVVCQPLSTGGTCASGRRCCGREGASCPNGNCDCCEGFACNVAGFTCAKFP
jgi:hypothetical protein